MKIPNGNSFKHCSVAVIVLFLFHSGFLATAIDHEVTGVNVSTNGDNPGIPDPVTGADHTLTVNGAASIGVTADFDNGVHFDLSTDGLATNLGIITTGGVESQGILFSNSLRGTSFNEGRIVANNGGGGGLTFKDSTIGFSENRGVIEMTSFGNNGFLVERSSDIQLVNRNQILGAGGLVWGAYILNSAKVDLKNYGTIHTTGAASTGVTSQGTTQVSILNTGKIEVEGARTRGIAVTGGDTFLLENTGDILVKGDDARGVTQVSGTATIENLGRIETIGSRSPAIRFNQVTGAEIDNSGTIRGAGDQSHGILALSSPNLDITNRGIIQTTMASAHGIFLQNAAVSAQPNRIRNTGLIEAPTAIRDEAGKVILHTSGTIRGDIATFLDDDEVYFLSGSVTTGSVDLGVGSDSTVVSRGADLSGVSPLDGGDDVYVGDGFIDRLRIEGGDHRLIAERLLNWESIRLMGGSALTLRGAVLQVGGGQGAGGEVLGLSLERDSLLKIAGSNFSVQGDLSHGGVIDLRNRDTGDFKVATDPGGPSGHYTGRGGSLLFDTVLGKDQSPTDRLVVDGATSGRSSLFIQNLGGEGAQTKGNGIQVVQVNGASQGKFTLGNPMLIAGAYEYDLFAGGVKVKDGHWYLRSQLAPTTPVYEGIPVTFERLIPRLTHRERYLTRTRMMEPETVWEAPAPAAGDGKAPVSDAKAPLWKPKSPVQSGKALAASNDRNVALWVRTEGETSHLEPDYSTTKSEFDVNRTMYQVGADFLLLEKNESLLIGSVTSHQGWIETEVGSPLGTGLIDAEGVGGGVGLTYYHDSGFYIDGLLQGIWIDSDIQSREAGTLVTGNEGFARSESVEFGLNYRLSRGRRIVPQVQITHTQVDFDTFTDPFGSVVSSEAGDSVVGRIGLSLEHEKSWGGVSGRDRSFTHYGIVNFHQILRDENRVDVSGTTLETELDALVGEVGVGGVYRWNEDRYALYGEVNVQTGLEEFGESHSLGGTVGVRLHW